MLFSVFFFRAFAYEVLDKNEINCFDRNLINSYSDGLDTAGTIVTAGMIAAPALLVLVPTVRNEFDWSNGGYKSALWLGATYAESLACAWLAKEGLKHLVSRERPYMYFSGAPENEIEDGEYKDSFPSGHTTLAFCSAAFMTASYCKLFPESDHKLAVGISSFALAAMVGASRVAAGCHFTTDVLAGAVIGTTFGLLFPMLQIKQENIGFAFTGNGVAAHIDF